MDQSAPRLAPPLCILVVDDEPLVRFVALEMFAEEGFRVLEAGSAREAITILSGGWATIDLVFSDIQMPGGLDGCDLARWVRDNMPGIRVILTSGRVLDEALPGDLRALAPILRKPYRPDEAVSRVRV